jgi:hypothetical protein
LFWGIRAILHNANALRRATVAGKTGGTNKSKFSASHASPARVASDWHAVAIKPKGQCCEAVQARRSARFLSADAPRLPLAECSTSDTCSCVYKHHADRRSQPRRQDEKDGLRRGGKVVQERRLPGDRRKTEETGG